VTESVVLPPLIGGVTMPQSKLLLPFVRHAPRVPWIGALATSFLLWVFLVWCILQVSVDLF
jgi:hypothetical protein